MNQTLTPSLPKAKELAFSKKLDRLLSQLRENNQATKEIHKETDKLKRSNDLSFNRAKKAVESLANY